MPEHRQEPQEISAEHIRNPETAHEYRDVNVRGVLLFALILLVVALFVHLILVGMFKYMEARAERAEPPPHPLSLGSQPPPQPRLQSNPARDMERLRQSEDGVLSSYGWMDREHGVTRIPIDRAIELTAERGLPPASGMPTVPSSLQPGPK